jgi:hypothetical protein
MCTSGHAHMSLTIWTQASNQRIGTELHKILVPVEGLARISGFTIGPESITNNTSFKSTGEKWFDRTLLACFPFSISCVTRIFVQATVRVHRLGLVTRSSYSLLPLWASNSPRTDHTWAGLEIAGHRDTVGTVKKSLYQLRRYRQRKKERRVPRAMPCGRYQTHAAARRRHPPWLLASYLQLLLDVPPPLRPIIPPT